MTVTILSTDYCVFLPERYLRLSQLQINTLVNNQNIYFMYFGKNKNNVHQL
jgi:hypothetical protein